MFWKLIIDNFVTKSDMFEGWGDFSILKLFLIKLSCYHDNYFQYFMFELHNDFVSKARVSACMYFLVKSLNSSRHRRPIFHVLWKHFILACVRLS